MVSSAAFNDLGICEYKYRPMKPLAVTAVMIQKAMPANPPKLNRKMQGDHERGRRAQHDVKIQPMTRISLPSKPAPPFAKRVKIDQEKHEDPEHTQIDADRTARAQQHMLGREGPVFR